MLFKNLMNLSILNDAFYFSDQDLTIQGVTYTIRSFTYRLAPYTAFELPNAKDSRGTAFYTIKDKDDWKIFTRAYPKFWNLNEGVSKEDYIKDNPVQKCFNKLDGSLILVGKIGTNLIAKSKTSINSEQAQMSQELLNFNKYLRLFCEYCITFGKTPVFEFIGSDNVIVLRYPVKRELVFLGAVDNKTGEITIEENPEQFYKKWKIKCADVFDYTWDELFKIQETSKPSIEGFVVKSKKGLCKCKVQSYVELHHLKDSVNNIKSLASLIIDDNLDDLIGSFRDDKATIDYILEVQEEISNRYNTLVKQVEKLYNENKHLSRKDYAIKLKKYGAFGLIMSKYLDKEVDYKDFFMKNKMYEGL